MWEYIEKHDLTYNELHDFQYPSIGCIPCTSQVSSSGIREGRWTNFNKQNVACTQSKTASQNF